MGVASARSGGGAVVACIEYKRKKMKNGPGVLRFLTAPVYRSCSCEAQLRFLVKGALLVDSLLCILIIIILTIYDVFLIVMTYCL